MTNKDGAGIIVVRKFNNEFKVLGLKANNYNDDYDIPKGTIEKNETSFECACRETKEESNIVKLNFEWGKDYFQALGTKKAIITIYLASTVQNPLVTKNPDTGIYEHQSAEWLTFDELEKKIYYYLIPALKWARNIINTPGEI